METIHRKKISTQLELGLEYGRFIKSLLLIATVFCNLGCTDFVEIDPPKNTLVSETVFEDSATVSAALANIYYNMREQGMTSGNLGIGITMGTYADELDYYGSSTSQRNLYNHSLSANDATVLSWWNGAYRLIYAANDIIKGLDKSTKLTDDTKSRCKGQALFVRGYMHSLLVAVYGDIPYTTTTNYMENNVVSRMPQNLVYELIIEDLLEAVNLLDSSDTTGEQVLPDKSVAKALLARMYLYTENWELAEQMASELINAHQLELDIDKVFLKSSKETLWQFKPGPNIRNTLEAGWLVINFVPTQGYALTPDLLNAFESGDLRRSHWVGSKTSTDGLTTLYFAHKYKHTVNTTASSLEYPIVFRLSEQYLIRAEVRTHMENIVGSQTDLNTIRHRAGLENTLASSKEALLDAIIKERRVELFCEHGHRWFDLKRNGLVDQALVPIKSNWKPSNELLPIPEAELEVNPNLKPQNTGY